MRILVVGPETGDCFAHNVAHTLRRLGHDVRTAPRPEMLQQRGRLARGADEVLGRASRAWRERAERRAVRLTREFRPELSLFTTGTLEPFAVRAMRRASGGRAVLWFGDAAANLRRGHVTGGEYDAVFFKDRDFARRLRDVLGLAAHYLPEACNPDWHRPVALPAGRHVLVAGTCYGYRNRLIERLIEHGVEVRVHGPAPPAWAPPRVVAAHAGTYLDQTTKAAAFGAALACLASFAPAESPATVNCRVFEIAGCGGLLLAEARPALAEFFEPGRECLEFSSLEQALELLARLERDAAWAGEIRTRAARRAHAEHSYERRLAALFEVLGIGR